MPVTIIALTAALLYLAATGLQLLHISQQRQQIDRTVFLLGSAALVAHALVAWDNLFFEDSLDLGFYKVSALIFLVINLACIASLVRRPLQNLLVALFPLSALSVLVSTFAPSSATDISNYSGGMLLHISSSILAYAILTLAAIQAGLVAVQDRHLKHKQTRGIIQVLPPLQLMETMLFELIWAGVALLSLSIASGIVFVDDIFAQHLVHKTVLTIIAWVIFSILLWGRYQLGWRSQTAVRFTLAGFALLMLAYFGSKLVLELVLEQA
ncbi:MAG: cytochrome c biogenesis protein CcsA [Halioglobus sp.]